MRFNFQMQDTQLIFSFYRHPSFGLSLDAYLVSLLENKTFSYNYQRLVYDRMNDYAYPYTEEEKKVLRKISELSPKSIEQQFNKKQIRSNLFLEKLANDKEQMKMLSAYFDRRLSACLELLKGQKVYWKERVSDHPGMQSFLVESEPAHVTYFFDRQPEGIQYRLMVEHDSKKLDLKKPGAEILSQSPCWLLLGNSIYHFDDGTDGNKITPFLKQQELHIPDKLADKFLESFMLRASRRFHVQYSGFNVLTEPERIQAVISIENSLDKSPVLQLNFQYDRFTVTAAQEQEMIVSLQREENGMKLMRFTRDKQFELNKTGILESTGLKRVKPSWFLPEHSEQKNWTRDQLLEWLSKHKDVFSQQEIELDIVLEGKRFIAEQARVETRVVKEDTDWFDVLAVVLIGGFEIPFIKFRRNILEHDRYFKLPDGRMMLLPEAWFSEYADLFEFGETNDSSIRLHKQHEGLLNNHPLLNGDLNTRLSEAGKSLYTDSQRTEFVVSENLNATLRDYQKKGFDWMCRLSLKGLGACLADDMGLGKTLQVISVLLWSKERQVPKLESPAPQIQLDLFGFSGEIPRADWKIPSLIVMAPSLVYNWENELRKFAPTLRIHKHLGQRRTTDPQHFGRFDIVLTTYGIVRNDVDLLKQTEFDYIVLDESQLIKNARSVSFQTVKQLVAQQRIVLTGTPVENSLTDLWAQLTFLQPGLLGSFKFFRQEFVIPIEQQQDAAKLEKLRKIIQPFILRRTKEEVAPELPELTRSVHYCEMSPEQKEYYEEQKSVYRNKILENISREGLEKSQLLILRGLTHLRQIAIHPQLLDSSYTGESAKMDQVLELLSQLRESGRKVLMFSPFVRHLNIYRKYFQEQKLPFSFLAGEVPMQQRAGVIQEFDQHTGHRVFLIQLKTGGSGLNLTKADNVFLLDPWWNPAAEDQAIARSHRIGQHQPVFAWRFITKDTIEEKILHLQERKTRLANDILEGTSSFRTLTEEELTDLFG
ncbi:MAG TPA: DEAD/DEAH box helicase [Flavobacteriales bacterium]|nr:DEAD/DEAH box helicase [Flavobacteriales bacterium]